MSAITVTVGIPAFNEEKNILRLLESVMLQKGHFKLEKIIVVNDGSTDQTAKIVANFSKKNPKVNLVNAHKRRGKSSRLNQIYKLNKSAVLITFDADVVLADENVIEKLTKPFSNNKIGLVGGNYIPFIGKTTVEKAVIAYEKFWAGVRSNINRGHNVHSFTGCVAAMSQDLVSKLEIPANIVAQDHYIYFKTKHLGYEYRFIPSAVINFKVPNNLKDYLKQTTRFLSSVKEIENSFDKQTEKDYFVPMSLKLRSYLKTFVEEPVFLPLALILQIYQRLLSWRFVERKETGIWSMIQSSK